MFFTISFMKPILCAAIVRRAMRCVVTRARYGRIVRWWGYEVILRDGAPFLLLHCAEMEMTALCGGHVDARDVLPIARGRVSTASLRPVEDAGKESMRIFETIWLSKRRALAPAVRLLRYNAYLPLRHRSPPNSSHLDFRKQLTDLSTLYTYQTPKSPPRIPRQPTTTKMSHTAFFYGTLMAPPVLHRVIWGSQTPPTPAHASLLHIRPAILHAHQRHKVKHADYPAILPKPSSSSCVRGTLVEGLTDGDIWRLDIFEGSEYERRRVMVRFLEGRDKEKGEEGMGNLEQAEEENIEGEEVEAETYIWIAGANRLEAEEWDFAEFVRDKMKRWVGREAEETDEGFKGRPSINGVCDWGALESFQKADLCETRC